VTLLWLHFYIISRTFMHINFCSGLFHIADNRNCWKYYANVLIKPVCRHQSWLLATPLTRIQKLPRRPVQVR